MKKYYYVLCILTLLIFGGCYSNVNSYLLSYTYTSYDEFANAMANAQTYAKRTFYYYALDTDDTNDCSVRITVKTYVTKENYDLSTMYAPRLYFGKISIVEAITFSQTTYPIDLGKKRQTLISFKEDDLSVISENGNISIIYEDDPILSLSNGYDGAEEFMKEMLTKVKLVKIG